MPVCGGGREPFLELSSVGTPMPSHFPVSKTVENKWLLGLGSWLLFVCLFSETRSHYVVLAVSEFLILLPHSPKCWIDRHESPYLANDDYSVYTNLLCLSKMTERREHSRPISLGQATIADLCTG